MRAHISAQGNGPRGAGPCRHSRQPLLWTHGQDLRFRTRTLGVGPRRGWRLLSACPRTSASDSAHCTDPATSPSARAHPCSVSVSASMVPPRKSPHLVRLALSLSGAPREPKASSSFTSLPATDSGGPGNESSQRLAKHQKSVHHSGIHFARCSRNPLLARPLPETTCEHDVLVIAGCVYHAVCSCERGSWHRESIAGVHVNAKHKLRRFRRHPARDFSPSNAKTDGGTGASDRDRHRRRHRVRETCWSDMSLLRSHSFQLLTRQRLRWLLAQDEQLHVRVSLCRAELVVGCGTTAFDAETLAQLLDGCPCGHCDRSLAEGDRTGPRG